MLLALFILWRLFLVIISNFSHHFIKTLDFFSYPEFLDKYKSLPLHLYYWGKFDGIHYMLIAKQGYSQFQQAFFPLYPLFIRLLNEIIHNYLISGLLISNVSFLTGLYIFKTYLIDLKIKNWQWAIIFLLTFPTIFFAVSVYTEGLFFLLLISSLYLLNKEKYVFFFLTSVLSSLTRLVGIFLIIPILLHFYFKLKNKNDIKAEFPKVILSLIGPILGLVIYSLYLFKTKGDFLLFFHAQSKFGLNRSTHLITPFQTLFRYLKILIIAHHNWQYFVSLTELSFFTFTFLLLSYDLYYLLFVYKKRNNVFLNLLALNLFSFANLLLPTFTGTLVSIPRFSLISISIFIILSRIRNVRIKVIIVLLSTSLQILLLSFFSQGYFVS